MTKKDNFLSIYRICGSKVLCLTHQQEICGEKIFMGTNFRELVFDRENCEISCLAKISRYTVSQVYHHVLHRLSSTIMR